MKTSPVLVETSSASLDTLAVTIKALHVNGKQMTLAVFRQIPNEPHQDGDAYWGMVRYTLPVDGGDRDKWFVFSRDGRLFRRPVDLRERKEPYDRFVRKELESIKERDRMGAERVIVKGKYVDRDSHDAVAYVESLEKAIEQDRIDTDRRNAEERARITRDKALFAELPQLFIAV